MRKFFDSIAFKIILGIVVVLAGLMVYSAANPGKASFPEKVLTVISAPFQKAAAAISGGFSSIWENFTAPGKIADENQELKDQINELNNKLIDYENYKAENERLKELLEIKTEKPNLTLLSADIIARDTDDYGTAFTIDKGSTHGIELRDTVMTSAGMVGVVVEVYPTTARVATVLSPDLQIGARVIRTRDTGVVSGVTSLALQGNAKLSYISRDSDISAGDIVVTSGASGMYPQDLILGTVQSVETETNGISLYAVLSAVENVNDIKSVFVVTAFDGEIKE